MIPPEDLIKAAKRLTVTALSGDVPGRVVIPFAREATAMANAFAILSNHTRSPSRERDPDEATDMLRLLDARSLQVDQLRRRLGRIEGAARSVVSEGASLDLLASALAESDDDWRALLPNRKDP